MSFATTLLIFQIVLIFSNYTTYTNAKLKSLVNVYGNPFKTNKGFCQVLKSLLGHNSISRVDFTSYLVISNPKVEKMISLHNKRQAQLEGKSQAVDENSSVNQHPLSTKGDGKVSYTSFYSVDKSADVVFEKG